MWLLISARAVQLTVIGLAMSLALKTVINYWSLRDLPMVLVTRAPGSEIIYKCSDYYAPECDRALKWDDETIGVDWGITADAALLSGKDANAPVLADLDNPFEWSQP